MQVIVDNSVNIESVRHWLNEHKGQTGKSWPEIGRLTDIGGSTLSLFSSDKYAGDNAKIATKISAYRDRLSAQAEIGDDLPMVPEWYETETSRHVTRLLRWAQSGRIVLIVTVPGVGKTRVAERFAAADPNVWLATMSPATAGVGTMAAEVAEAIGLGQITGSPQQLSRKVRDHVRGKNGLIIVDEAQELTDKAINEIRGWHDRTKVGIALLGNDKVISQFDSRKSALAQVSSRFSYRHEQLRAFPGDVEACLDAWGIQDDAQRSFLVKLAALPGALREVTHTIEVALMVAFGEGTPLTLSHLRAAARQRNAKWGAL